MPLECDKTHGSCASVISFPTEQKNMTADMHVSARGGKAWRNAGAAAFMVLSSSFAMAQTPPGVTLACPAPYSNGVTASVSTAAGVWETQGPAGGAWNPAAAASYPTWLPVPNATWIGNAVTGDAGDWRYRVVIDASDPNIDLSSATLTFAYRTDNDMLSANLGATSLPVLPSATYNAVTPGTGGPISTPLTAGSNQLLVVTNNEGTTPSPYGLTMEATLTFNCRAGAPAAVPADAPWALMGLGGLLAASVAWAGRRRRKQS